MTSKRFPWVFTVLWLLVLMVMIWAGFWQLKRAEEKKTIADKVVASINHQPESIEDWSRLTAFDQVTVSGRFSDTHFLLDNQIVGGQVGYFVYSSFILEQGIWVLINRGWSMSDGLNLEVQDGGDYTVTALVADWPEPGVQLGEQTIANDAIQHVTYMPKNEVIELLKARHCEQNNSDECIILPRVLKLGPDMDNGFIRKWSLPRMTVEKHQAYALQWFTMSLVLCLVYLIFLKKTYLNE